MEARARLIQLARSAAVAFVLLACSRPKPPDVPGDELAAMPSAGEQRPAGTVRAYRLVTVGGQQLPYGADSSFDRPCVRGLRAMEYQLVDDRWVAVYTQFERCADHPEQPESRWVLRDTGVFVLRGDTIQFEAVAPNAYEPRILLLGLLRGDTLTTWGSDLDGGDYVFVAEKRP